MSNNTRNDRIFGAVLLALAIGFFGVALAMHVPFAYDPLGPKAFPMILSLALGVMALSLIARPASGTGLPGGRVGLQLLGVLIVLVAYGVLFTRIGYLISTVAAMTILARIFGATWIKAGITGVALTASSYALFAWALGIALPIGSWLVY
ncbi:tripartite tricarboxylate transporter TctB family protein [Salinisphaera sp. SPP-AMP-43]|uniref:tripartite tricarboxylate transporter TctB family protein n=1 Tax=Salinisphaera sp. SPP-AMP-43 TaxID=3121288 RepID=UPI003C6E53AD